MHHIYVYMSVPRDLVLIVPFKFYPVINKIEILVLALSGRSYSYVQVIMHSFK